MGNYIASKILFKNLDVEKYTVQIDGKIYHWYGDDDPEYLDDGVLDISYWDLFDADGKPTNMVLAFDRREDMDDPQE
ncbi:MAG: hypothetical protein HPY66_1682 [Firmicutes bacterium]|nr:hypothetical protein [Bacillota bacterium]